MRLAIQRVGRAWRAKSASTPSSADTAGDRQDYSRAGSPAIGELDLCAAPMPGRRGPYAT
jgi:hypothetical protein